MLHKSKSWFLRKLFYAITPVHDWKIQPLRRRFYDSALRLFKRGNFREIIFLFKVSYLIFATCLFYPLGILISLSKYRILLVDLEQIGSLIYLDPLVKLNILGEKKYIYIIPVNPLSSTANTYAIDLYREHVIFARSFFAILCTLPFYYNKFCTHDSKAVECSYDSIRYEAFTRYGNEISDKPIPVIPQHDLSLAKKLITDICGERPIVTLHVRDAGFYKESRVSMRNADVRTYFKMVRYLVDIGYCVVRMGGPSSAELDERFDDLHPCFFDYAKSELRSEMLDVCLIAISDFFIATSSGLSSVTSILDVPLLYTNAVCAGDSLSFNNKDITLFKKYLRRETGKFVGMEQLFSRELGCNPPSTLLEHLGIEVVDNTSDELLDAAKEMIARLNQSDLPTPLNDSLLELRYSCPIARWNRGKFSESFLEVYLENMEK